MKTLSIIRHAKSSWDYSELLDYDRPLNKRGRRNIHEMGGFLQGKFPTFDKILSSPANRALTTAIQLAPYLGYQDKDIQLCMALYHAVVGDIVEVISQQNKEVEELLIYGHNPGLTSFVNRYGDQYIDNIPTCGFVSITFDIPRWDKMANAKGKTLSFFYPKGIK